MVGESTLLSCLPPPGGRGTLGHRGTWGRCALHFASLGRWSEFVAAFAGGGAFLVC